VTVWIRAGLVVVFAYLLVGCGSSSESGLEGAADATAAETSRFEMTSRITGIAAGGEALAVRVSGLFDYPRELGVMRMDESGAPTDVPMDEVPSEFRLIGNTAYERWSVKGKTYWVKEQEPELSGDPAELLIPLPGGVTKPTDVLSRVLAASKETELLGEEKVRGVEARHFRAQVDGRKLLEQLPSDKRPDPEEVWGGRFVPVELWIDEESRLRRLKLSEEFSEDGPDSMVMTIELFDYGVEVDVQPPPGEQLIFQEELDELIGTGWKDYAPESGKDDPATPEQVCRWARKELPKDEAANVCADVQAAAEKEKQ
jgi:hypothetical protein